MKYEDLDEHQKSLFITIMQDNSYKELVDFCRSWLKVSAKYDSTREGLKLFMSKHDIFCDYSVPTKTTITLCAIKMLEIDADETQIEVNEEAKRIKEKTQEVRKDYIKVGKQGNRDVIVHKDDLPNYLEACYEQPDD